jgi:hypothetical protein
MHRRIVVLVLAGLIAALIPAAAQAGGRSATAELTGGAVLPGPGDPDGSGFVSLNAKPGQRELCYQLSVDHITEPTGGFIQHIDSPDGTGPIVYRFGLINVYPPPVGDVSFSGGGCESRSGPGSADFKAFLQGLHSHPEEYYVSFTTLDFPGGAIRGDLR